MKEGMLVREEALQLLLMIYVIINSGTLAKEQISPAAVNMEEQMFNRMVNILYTQGLISAVTIKIGEEDNQPPQVSMADVMLTRKGADFAETSAGIAGSATKTEKLRKIRDKAIECGWDTIRALVDKALASQ